MKWTKSDNSEITSGGGEGFIIDAVGTGAGFSVNTHITTLTVPDTATDQDKTYNCLVTSNEHGGKKQSQTVNLKVFSEYSKLVDCKK